MRIKATFSSVRIRETTKGNHLTLSSVLRARTQERKYQKEEHNKKGNKNLHGHSYQAYTIISCFIQLHRTIYRRVWLGGKVSFPITALSDNTTGVDFDNGTK